MIDLSQLTQEQLWGVQYVCMLANEPIKAENEQIAQANNSLAEGDEPKPLKDLFTPETYMEYVIRQACDSYHKQVADERRRRGLAKYDALSPEEKAAFDAQLGLEDVLPT